MYGGWKQNQRTWNQWSPQLPKKANRQTRKKEDNQKDQQAGVLRAYDAAPGGGGSSSTSSTSNNAGQQEALFFKEFVNFVKETKCELPENLQKFLPNEDKENLREQQKKLNKQRNLHAKINNKQKALEQDKEKWTSWIASVKEEVQLQKGKHEESQKKLSKELEDLQEELRRVNNNEEEPIEITEDQDIEEILDTMTSKAEEEETSKKLEEMQAEMEQRYQLQIEEERKRMQQHFSEQFIQLARANMDPYMPTEMTAMASEETVEQQEVTTGTPPGLVGLVRNPVAPFGVQRAPKPPTHVSSPYGEKKDKEPQQKESQKKIMDQIMESKLKDTGQ